MGPMYTETPYTFIFRQTVFGKVLTLLLSLAMVEIVTLPFFYKDDFGIKLPQNLIERNKLQDIILFFIPSNARYFC